MPYGMSWPHYGALITLSLSSMLAGASVVHYYYKPDLTIPDQVISAPAVTPTIAIVAPRGQPGHSGEK